MHANESEIGMKGDPADKSDVGGSQKQNNEETGGSE